MSSTNKTTNYELSQFIGTDKPAWLADYNSDMNKIDGGIHTAQTTATSADGKADANTTAIGTLSSLETTDKSSVVSAINEVNTNANTAQNTATSASSSVTALTSKFNLNQVKENLTVTSTLGTVTLNTVKIMHNSDGSVAQISGTINIGSVSGATADVDVTISGTGLYPSADKTVDGCALITLLSTGGNFTSVIKDFKIKNDGTITFTQPRYTDTAQISMQFVSCMIFV